MSRPRSSCVRTMSATALRTRAARAARSTPGVWIKSSRSSGRGRLPACVVRILPVLCFMAPYATMTPPEANLRRGDAMKQLTRLRISLLVALALAGPAGAQEKVTSPNAQVAHLGLHGVFTIDTRELAAKDPRNPKRIVFTEMTTASFFDDAEGKAPIARDCRYAYRGAAGDPYH